MLDRCARASSATQWDVLAPELVGARAPPLLSQVATSTLRTIRKLGLDETAKKYDVDLSKF